MGGTANRAAFDGVWSKRADWIRCVVQFPTGGEGGALASGSHLCHPPRAHAGQAWALWSARRGHQPKPTFSALSVPVFKASPQPGPHSLGGAFLTPSSLPDSYSTARLRRLVPVFFVPKTAHSGTPGPQKRTGRAETAAGCEPSIAVDESQSCHPKPQAVLCADAKKERTAMLIAPVGSGTLPSCSLGGATTLLPGCSTARPPPLEDEL